jgi:hypothetical protein
MAMLMCFTIDQTIDANNTIHGELPNTSLSDADFVD